MKLKIWDIPAEGKSVEFLLDSTALNSRVAEQNRSKEHSLATPPYVFIGDPAVTLHLNLEGSTIVISGNVAAELRTVCSRCAEEVRHDMKVPANMILKPHSAKSVERFEDDDVGFGFYDGEDVDCASFIEELLILALPYSLLCRPDCKGLCPECGKNKNLETCDCGKEAKVKDPRFKVLEGLKVH